jgi:uncharacterized protein YndB with AHSA1/START domain
MDTPFILEAIYEVPIEKVWQALTSENSMRIWYFPQLIKFKPVVGFKFEFTNDGSSYQKVWEVTRVVESRLLAHSWVYKGYAGSSEVTFTLFDLGNETRLQLTHTGLASFPNDPHFARHRFEDGWKNILTNNLKLYLEKTRIA